VLLNYHIGRLVLVSLCVGDLVWLVLGGVRYAGFSLLLMMGAVTPETCRVIQQWNKLDCIVCITLDFYKYNITNCVHALHLCVLYASRNKQPLYIRVISNFRLEVAETCAILGSYSASRGNFLLTFRDNLSVPSSGLKYPNESLLPNYSAQRTPALPVVFLPHKTLGYDSPPSYFLF